MSDQTTRHPQATPEHEQLARRAGRWQLDCTWFFGPEPTHGKGSELVERLGPFWTQSRFEAELMGTQLVGSALSGYEPHSGRFVSTWVDNMSPHLYVFSGGLIEGGQALELSAQGPDPQSGKPASFRSVERWEQDDRRSFDMYLGLPDGTEHRMLHYAYTRLKG